MSSDERVELRQLLRGALQALPQAGAVNRGLWHLATSGRERHKSIGLRLEQLARRQPQRTALLYRDQNFSYAQFNAWANRYARLFAAEGVGRGDSVALMLENRPELLAAVAGALKLGAIAGMINTNQRGEVLAHSLGLVDARVAVIGAECAEAVRELPEKGRAAFAGRLFWAAGDDAGEPPAGWRDAEAESARLSAENPPQTAEVQLKDPCFYIFTSGTTGLPKASVMSHGRWFKAMAGVGMASLRLKADDIFYCPLPLYHNNALTLTWGAVLGAGASLALTRKFSASRFWDEIREFDATCFCYIGELCRYLLNQPPGPGDRDHRVRVCVGNGLRPDIWDEFKSRFGIERINEFYGASEGNLVFTNGFGADRSAGFCPLTYAVVEYDTDADAVRRDDKGRLRKVAAGGVGLLITQVTERSPFEGYTDKAATEKKLLRDAFKAGDCWFNTGDLVRDQGWRHIAFVDRVGDTFRWKGENVATTEVEAVLNHCPGVEQAAVYGVQVPAADGRAGMAAISLSAPAEELDLQGLATQLREALPAYAVPVFLRLVAAHETTATFKLRKVELKREGWSGDADVFVLRAGEKAYEALTPELRESLEAGALRL